MDCRVVSLQGGDKHNAIPREAFATVLISPEAMADAQIIVSKREQGLNKEFGSKEKNLKISFAGLDDSPDKTLTEESQTALIGLLRTIPHGVLKYSHDVEGLVETSNNLAAVKCDGGNYNIVSSTRSSISDALELQRERIALMSKVYGAKVEQDEAYPGWAPDLNSSILEITTKIYAEMLDGEPNVCAIHAGLECGVIGEKVNGMDMISFGPTIKGPHSPDERVDIPSVKKFWDLLLRILEELAEK
jgi:dipeptidase D